jgi:hypothetical protein
MSSSSFRYDQIDKCLRYYSHFVVLLKSDLDVQQTDLRVMNFVTPKAGTKHELLFNKPASVT